MAKKDVVDKYKIKWIDTQATPKDVSSDKNPLSSSTSTTEATQSTQQTTTHNGARPIMYYSTVVVPTPPPPPPKKSKIKQKKFRLTTCEKDCKEMNEDTFANDRMLVQILSIDFDCYKFVGKNQDEAPYVILCYPDGKVYKAFEKKVGDGTLASEMRKLLQRLNKDQKDIEKARSIAIIDWQRNQEKLLELQAEIKEEEADMKKQKKKKATPKLERLKEDQKKLQNLISEAQKNAK